MIVTVVTQITGTVWPRRADLITTFEKLR